MATKIQLRRDTAADWTSTNPTLAAGEIGFESDTNKFKIGDGATAWTSLNYAPEGYATTSYVDTQDANIASDSLVFTNKTFDANGTGNSISNIETADMAAGTLVTAAEGIGSNDNDTTIPTSAAVKAYADSVGGGTITALNNQAENRLTTIGATTTELDGEANLTFDGTTLTLTGSAALDGVTIADNTITTNRSNDNLEISANGTGQVELGAPFDTIRTATRYDYGVNTAYVNDSWDANTRIIANNSGINATMTATGGTDFEIFSENRLTLQMAGYSATSDTRGVESKRYNTVVNNNSATATTIKNLKGLRTNAEIYPANGDITATNTYSMYSSIIAEPGVGRTATYTNAYNYYAKPVSDLGGGGTTAATNSYGFYHDAGSVATNTYAFYDASNSLSVFGDIQTQAVSITDNLITTNRSNDNLFLEANGTGRIELNSNGTKLADSSWTNYHGVASRIHGVAMVLEEDVNPDTLTDRRMAHAMHYGNTLTASSSTNSNWRPRAMSLSTHIETDGFSYTRTGIARGPVASMSYSTFANNHATNDSTIANTRGSIGGNALSNFNSPASDITLSQAIAYHGQNSVEGDGAGAMTITDSYLFYGDSYIDKSGAGAGAITNQYGFYYAGGGATNNYAFYDASNSLSVFGDIQTQGVSITDNLITTNRSNDDLNIQANGTGRINAVAPLQDAALWSALFGAETRVKGFRASHENLAVDADTLTDREYGHALHLGTKLTNGSSTNSNFRPRGTLIQSGVDLDGNSYTVSSITRGPLGAQVSSVVQNSSGTAATLATLRGIESSASVSEYNGSAGDITVTNAIGNQALNEFVRDGSGDITVTNSYGFHSNSSLDHTGTGTANITNDYGFYVNSLAGTNKYAFYDNTNSLSRFGAVILANQASDPSGVTDSSHIYAKDDAGSSEVYVRDEAGNVTKISPHNEAGEWQYWSENIKTGKKVRINMERMIRRLEEITGETFIENE